MSGMTRDDVEHAFHVGIGDQGVEREVRGTEEAGRQLAEYARAIEHAGGGFIRVLRRWGVDPTWENALDTSYDGRRWHTDPSRSVGRPLRDDVVLGPSSDPALPRLVRHSVHREPARRPTGGASGDRFGARAVDHRGGVVWEKTGSSVKGLMDAADREVPKSKARSVVIREDYTSDGTYWGSGHGRVVASREGGGGRGPGGWIVEGYDVHHGAVNRAGAKRGGKVIEGVDELFEYVNRLGFAGSGSMHYRQHQLGVVYDALLTAAGGDFPFRARFHTHRSEQGFTFPWLGEFEVDGKNGHVVVSMSRVRS